MRVPEPADEDDLHEQHEINVTPFIDVMLVLLIIFMMAAPLSTLEIPLQLPSSRSATPPEPAPPLQLSLGTDGVLRLGREPVPLAELGRVLDARGGRDPERPVLLAADRDVGYPQVIAVLDQLRAHGYYRVGLVVQETTAP